MLLLKEVHSEDKDTLKFLQVLAFSVPSVFNMTESNTALIIGVNSQDGYFLCKLLIEKGYFVFGTVRNATSKPPSKKFSDHPNFRVMHLDLQNAETAKLCMSEVTKNKKSSGPLEVYCLAAVSQVAKSVSHPISSADTNALGPLRILTAILETGRSTDVRFLFASSSEIFGNPLSSPQDEQTACNPSSPYGMSKLFATQQVAFQRKFHDLFACSAILFNHESTRRPPTFVTRKVTLTVSAISKGVAHHIDIGNLDAKRDWGHAEDYVHGMWIILQQSTPRDFVIGSGELHSVRELVEEAFNVIGVKICWSGTGLDEVGFDSETKVIRVKVNPSYYRAEDKKAVQLVKVADPGHVVADNTRIFGTGWRRKHSFHGMIHDMMMHDLALSRDIVCSLLGLK